MGLIKKRNELDVNVRIKMLIYGQPGEGKSTLALSAPDPLMIDCDNGINRVNYAHIKDTVQVKDYAEILEVLNKEDLSAYKTLIFDTGGKMLDLMANWIIKNYPKMAQSNGSLTQRGYGQRKVEFSNLLRLINSKDKDVVFVAHRKTERDNDNIRYVPLFGGSNYDDLATELDLIGYLEADGRRRTITFDPTSHADGKNTCNMPAMIEIPTILDESGNPIAENDFLSTKVFKVYRDRLMERSQEGEAYKSLIDTIKKDVDAIKSDKDATDFLDKQKSYVHIGNSQAVCRQLLIEKAKVLKLKYNVDKKAYEYDKVG